MSTRKDLIDASKERISTIEVHLAGTLRPVTPPRDFVRRMRDRIRLPEPRVIAKRLSNWEFVLIVVGGVMSVAVLIATVARALFHLFRRGRGGLTA